MKIALIGASGYVGKVLLEESLARGHEVTGLLRHPENLAPHDKLSAKRVDVLDGDALARLLSGHDAVISAFNPKFDEGLRGVRSILAATERAGVPRLLVVGGAASLQVSPGKRLIDMPDFPAEWKASALATAEELELLRREAKLDWTFLSPAASLVPGERTGQFRIGGETLLTGPDGQSRISVADYAVAMLDELERPAHSRQRFSVAY
jgi:putative NADH-flavin reductase